MLQHAFRPFQGFDTHEYGAARAMGLKRRVDAVIAGLVRRLEAEGELDRTVVCVASEFGRTVMGGGTGEHLVIEHERQYGLHEHFAGAWSMLFFGGPFKRGFVYGRTADRHPMVPVENPASLADVGATIVKAMGMTADVNDSGRPIDALLA